MVPCVGRQEQAHPWTGSGSPAAAARDTGMTGQGTGPFCGKKTSWSQTGLGAARRCQDPPCRCIVHLKMVKTGNFLYRLLLQEK